MPAAAPADLVAEAAARRWLMLASSPGWAVAARRALSRLGGGELVLAQSPQQALERLVEPNHGFCRLLLELSAAGQHVRDLLGVTVGEAGSQVDLLLLGDAQGLATHQGIQHAGTPADLLKLAGSAPRRAADLPSLSVAELAVSFRPEDLECRFQPIVSLVDRRPVGMETLVRLHHRERGTIGPDQFIPQIERGGLSLRLSEAVARGAMRAIDPAFIDAHDLYLTINLPLDVLLLPETLQRIDAHRRASAIPAHSVLIELTESRPVLDFPALTAAVEQWRQAGYRMAIDDMGPEMSNQAQLFDLPFTTVKLDKQIVLRSERDTLAQRYLQRTVDYAHSRSLSVIAEGIENEAMWNQMRDMGVEHAQGFLIARAMPAAALRAWLEAWSAQAGLPPDRGHV